MPSQNCPRVDQARPEGINFLKWRHQRQPKLEGLELATFSAVALGHLDVATVAHISQNSQTSPACYNQVMEV